jgi:hypothetical protein
LFWKIAIKLGLNCCGFGVQVPDAEHAQPMDVYPLMIDCNGFYVGDVSWFHHREKFLGSSMTGFLLSRFRRDLRQEEYLNRFFYSEFDPSILEERKSRREQTEGDGGRSSTSGLKDPKEEPVEGMTLDLENCWYSFSLRPQQSEAKVVACAMCDVMLLNKLWY